MESLTKSMSVLCLRIKGFLIHIKENKMKELKRSKQVKKKPGQFKKAQKRHQNIQHNRDQLKLLKEMKIDSAELFILDPEAFKKVTIVRHDCETSPPLVSGTPIVYLHNRGKSSKLRTGMFIDKDGLKVDNQPGGYIEMKHVFGIIVKEELLKEKDSNHGNV